MQEKNALFKGKSMRQKYITDTGKILYGEVYLEHKMLRLSLMGGYSDSFETFSACDPVKGKKYIVSVVEKFTDYSCGFVWTRILCEVLRVEPCEKNCKWRMKCVTL